RFMPWSIGREYLSACRYLLATALIVTRPSLFCRSLEKSKAATFWAIGRMGQRKRLSHNLCKPAERCRIEASRQEVLHMARRKRTPGENASREKSRELLQMANSGSMDDIQNRFKETIAEYMQNG